MNKSKKIKAKDKYFLEGYTVKFEYKKPDGFYEIKSEDVMVKVKHGINEKNNHQAAADIIKNKYKEVDIITVSYQ